MLENVKVAQIKKFKKQSPFIFEFCFWEDQSGAVGTKSAPPRTHRGHSGPPKGAFCGPNEPFLPVFLSWVVPYGLQH